MCTVSRPSSSHRVLLHAVCAQITVHIEPVCQHVHCVQTQQYSCGGLAQVAKHTGRQRMVGYDSLWHSHHNKQSPAQWATIRYATTIDYFFATSINYHDRLLCVKLLLCMLVH